jgi:hypothetical protein
VADERDPPRPFNPFLMWTDMAMRATEMMVSATQVVADTMDRSMRAWAPLQNGKGNPTAAVRESLRPANWGEKPATAREEKGSLTYPAQRRRRRKTRD